MRGDPGVAEGDTCERARRGATAGEGGQAVGASRERMRIREAGTSE